MKRCVICDSTDQFDVLEYLGFSTPITSWHVLDDPHGGDCCNRCFEVIQDTLLEQELEEEFTALNFEVMQHLVNATGEFKEKPKKPINKINT